MTDKEHKKTHKDEHDHKQSKTSKQDDKLQERIAKLEKDLAEAQEIAKRAQSDYFRFKIDMDSYMQRAEQNLEQTKVDALIQIAQKLLPAVAQLEQSVLNLPKELAENSWAAGVKLCYNKAMQELASI
ncbi:MAG: nucleotide exchange factor GrpE [Candidatus Peribacteria bacterium]|nr:MAG: nucleotide exchange factor GrpE [Candidatus Peribacteria bacterium]